MPVSPSLQVSLVHVHLVGTFDEPCFGLADDCRVQCRLSVETRTSAYHVRVGDFPEEQLSVYLTARRYGSLDPGETFNAVMHRLTAICQELVDEHVRDQVLRPLQETIAFK